MSTTITLDTPVRTQARAAQRGHVRLTRRGRVVVFVLALLVALAIGVALGGNVSATTEIGEPQATEVVVVNEGDTLWGIASGVGDGGDVREVMAEIEELNQLDSAVLDLGQELHVPVAD